MNEERNLVKMTHVFLHLLKDDLCSRKKVILILFSGIVICMYCICSMLGTAVGEYRMVQNWNDYSSLIVNPSTELPLDRTRISENITRKNNKDIANIIYLTRGENGIYIIGWDGTEQNCWFPHSSGRFFTEEEVQSGTNLAYVSEGYQEYDQSEEIRIMDDTYQVIGVGWMVSYNFTSMVPDESRVRLFTEPTPYDDGSSGKTREQYFKFIILPAVCYLRNFEPDQILIQINNADNKKLNEYKGKLEKVFPEAQVCLPKQTPEVELKEKTLLYIRRSLILSLIAGLTLFQLVIQWVRTSLREFSVYYLCGMTSKDILWMIYGRLLCYYLAGGIVAALLHRVTLPVLQFIYREEVPSYLLLAMMLGLIFLLISLVSFPVINKEVKGIREGI